MESVPNPIVMHIETDKVRQHGFHLGTDLRVAETFVYKELRKPSVKSVALRFPNGRLIRIYDYRDLPENKGD